MINLPAVFRDGFPGLAEGAEVICYFRQRARVVVDVGFHEAADQIRVEGIQTRGNLSAPVQVEGLLEFGDYGDHFVDEDAFVGDLILREPEFSLFQEVDC